MTYFLCPAVTAALLVSSPIVDYETKKKRRFTPFSGCAKEVETASLHM